MAPARARGNTALIPPGFLQWGVVHSVDTDFGTLTHVCQDEDGIYTAYVKGNKWEVRRWESNTAQCVSKQLIALFSSHLVFMLLLMLFRHECVGDFFLRAFRSTVIAASEDHIALKCFEVVGEYLFMCFASGKMEIINKTTQAAVRKGISAHGAEIKSIARGLHPFVYTACVDNQVRAAATF